MKKAISVFLAVMMLLLISAPSLVAVGQTDYVFCYTYSDVQVEKTSDYQTYNGNSNKITTVKDDWGGQDLPYNDASRGVRNANLIYLAKNEREGFQVYFYEQGQGRTLRLEVGEFRNADGVILPHEVFREEYFTPLGMTNIDRVSPLVLADALVPCGDVTEVQTTPNENETFYIEVRSAADQPAGVYYADVKLYDGDTLLTPTKNTTRVAAVVWDFALPQQHYGSMIVGLYNSASGYGDSCYFLKQNGVPMNGQGNVTDPADQERADAIVAGWNEYLLDHGISPYEIPRNLIDTDPKAAELAMADVRQKAFFVPLLKTDASNGSFNAATTARLNQYKDLIGDNAYLTGKAHLYLMDEPAIGWDGEPNQPVINALNARVSAAKNVWPEIDRVITYCAAETLKNDNHGYITFDKAVTYLHPEENTVVVNNSLLASRKGIFESYMTDFAGKWRYHGDIQNGSVELWYYGKSTNGSLRRLFFWQQDAMQDDMFLYWQAAYYGNTDVWATHTLPEGGGIQTGNGNGILLYPGTGVGQPAETPIGSLRIKQIASGIDDADYLALAKEFLGQEGYETALRRFLPNALTENNADQIFMWYPDSVGVWDMAPVNRARIALGNELEAAVGEHAFGEWQTVVVPDDTHNGLAIRTCANCGTEESKKIGLCDEGKHLFGAYTPADADTHQRSCELCGFTETAAHTPENVEAIPATCTEDGRTAGVICADCGYAIAAAETIPGGHRLGEWTAGEEATCVKAGVLGHYTCGVCGKFFDAEKNEIAEVVIPKDMNNHIGNLTVENAVAPTCTTAGYSGDSVCAACGNVKTPGQTIPATGHSWDAGRATRTPTCTAAGEMTYTCGVCGETRTEQISALGHTSPDANGKCARCGTTLVEVCKFCGKTHTGFLGAIVGFFHNIFYFFKTLFR